MPEVEDIRTPGEWPQANMAMTSSEWNADFMESCREGKLPTSFGCFHSCCKLMPDIGLYVYPPKLRRPKVLKDTSCEMGTRIGFAHSTGTHILAHIPRYGIDVGNSSQAGFLSRNSALDEHPRNGSPHGAWRTCFLVRITFSFSMAHGEDTSDGTMSRVTPQHPLWREW